MNIVAAVGIGLGAASILATIAIGVAQVWLARASGDRLDVRLRGFQAATLHQLAVQHAALLRILGRLP